MRAWKTISIVGAAGLMVSISSHATEIQRFSCGEDGGMYVLYDQGHAGEGAFNMDIDRARRLYRAGECEILETKQSPEISPEAAESMRRSAERAHSEMEESLEENFERMESRAENRKAVISNTPGQSDQPRVAPVNDSVKIQSD